MPTPAYGNLYNYEQTVPNDMGGQTRVPFGCYVKGGYFTAELSGKPGWSTVTDADDVDPQSLIVYTQTVVPVGEGDITAVIAGTGLSGGGTDGAVTLNVAAGGITATQLAANAVSTAKILDGNVTLAKLDPAIGTLSGLTTDRALVATGANSAGTGALEVVSSNLILHGDEFNGGVIDLNASGDLGGYGLRIAINDGTQGSISTRDDAQLLLAAAGTGSVLITNEDEGTELLVSDTAISAIAPTITIASDPDTTGITITGTNLTVRGDGVSNGSSLTLQGLTETKLNIETNNDDAYINTSGGVPLHIDCANDTFVDIHSGSEEDGESTITVAFSGVTIDSPVVTISDNLTLGAAGPTITWGAGAPASTPADGSLYIRTDGGAATTLYVRETGAWVGK